MATEQKASVPLPEKNEVIELILNHVPEEHLERVRSTILSFYFLHQHATALSQLREASPEYINERIHYLFANLKTLPDVEVPELKPTTEDIEHIEELVKKAEEERTFQKLNRNLFTPLDDAIEAAFKKEYTDVQFASPVIEWAENIIPELSDKAVHEAKEETLEAQWVHFLRDHDARKVLVQYLQSAYKAIQEQVAVLKSMSDPDVQVRSVKKLIDKLRCSMGYPERAASFVLQ